MDAPLDETYFVWLYSQIASIKLQNPARTYWTLARQLYTKEFVWFVLNDDNRAEDGKDLRAQFLEARDIHNPDPVWMDLGCSMFEMLIALSRKLSFEDDQEPKFWFWQLMENLGLQEYNDRQYSWDHAEAEKIVDETLDQVIWRYYSFDGRGGLFPLQVTMEDQRNVEIWYQLQAYLIEHLL